MSVEGRMRTIASRIVEVPGVRGVALGGSRARGAHRPDSDWDFGVYYSGEFDVSALQNVADEVADEVITLSARGGWGPWVDGGGWLTIDGAPVDWIYRDLRRVDEMARRAERGEYAFRRQPGHPLGFLDVAYVGELALSHPLADPHGDLEARRSLYSAYPPELGRAFVAGLWEAEFDLGGATKGADAGDAVWVAGVVFHALSIAAHALHGHAGRWVTNEKGVIAAAGGLPDAPDRFAERALECVAFLDADKAGLSRGIRSAQRLVSEVRSAVED